MEKIRNLMINMWKMKNIDWMGYELTEDDFFSYHHLIIPKSNGGVRDIWNGAILNRKSSHDYLHVIEKIDYDMFFFLTSELININFQKHMPTEKQLKHIDILLKQFEKEHCGEKYESGEEIIKEQYTIRKTYAPYTSFEHK